MHVVRSWYIHKRPRWMRWEFMPTWLFYIPLSPMFLYLMIRGRHPAWFTAVNPKWYLGGFVGEPKIEIQQTFEDNENLFPKTLFLSKNTTFEQNMPAIQEFMQKYNLQYPVMFKPNVGEKGNGIIKVKQESQWAEIFKEPLQADFLVQEFIDLPCELGVFVIRNPKTQKPYIFSITHKTILTVIGDGKNNLKTLIETHPRAWLMRKFFFQKHAAHLNTVIPENELYEIGDLGNHCKGALFEDGSKYNTPALYEFICTVCDKNKDFHYGRIDVKMDSLTEPKQFKLIEVNGTTSESTNMYDPKYTLLDAYKISVKHWTAQADIARYNIRNGVRPVPFFKTLKLIFQHL